MEIDSDQLQQNMNNSRNLTCVEKVAEVDEKLRKNIKDILNSISDEEVTGIVKSLKDVGLESLSDLQFVKEEDLSAVLKPIKRRKLVAVWSVHQFNSSQRRANKKSKRKMWNRKTQLGLLQVYARYKTEFFSPGVDVKSVWEKIACEMKIRFSFEYNYRECCQRIGEMQVDYENMEITGKYCRRPKYNAMQKAFDLEIPDCAELIGKPINPLLSMSGSKMQKTHEDEIPDYAELLGKPINPLLSMSGNKMQKTHEDEISDYAELLGKPINPLLSMSGSKMQKTLEDEIPDCAELIGKPINPLPSMSSSEAYKFG